MEKSDYYINLIFLDFKNTTPKLRCISLNNIDRHLKGLDGTEKKIVTDQIKNCHIFESLGRDFMITPTPDGWDIINTYTDWFDYKNQTDPKKKTPLSRNWFWIKHVMGWLIGIGIFLGGVYFTYYR